MSARVAGAAPTVLVVGGSPEGAAPRVVAVLAARADHVVAVDRGLDALAAAGVAPELFCGDVDSVSAGGAARVSAAEAAHGRGDAFEVERYRPEKDYTDLSLALRAINERWGAAALLCCGVGGGRPDHFLGVLGRLADWPGPVELVEEPCRGRVLHGGESWQLEGARGARFSFVPLSPSATVSLAGMHWRLEAAVVPLLSDLGISNTVEDATASIVCHDGVVAAWLFT